MLTKDLLCYRTNKGKISPKLIDQKSPKLIEIAEELIKVFSVSVGDIRETLEARTKIILNSSPANTLVGKGLEKLLLDRSEFDTEEKKKLTELREKVFTSSAALIKEKEWANLDGLKSGRQTDFEYYQNKIAKSVRITLEELLPQLYGDLPPFQKLLNFRKMTPVGLLNRYNCAQIQGLLLRSEVITVSLPESGAASLRQLLKYLRFNKLLARIRDDPKREKTLILEISGPLSLFVQTQKYGFNLANFFPAILQQPEWTLHAEVRIRKNQVHNLHLNNSCGISSHYRQFLAYIPDEIRLFCKKLAKQIPDWEISSSTDFIQLTGESLCFPDFLLRHNSGKKVSIELFHRWHIAPLQTRLEQLDLQSEVPLLIGVNRSLIQNLALSKQVEASEYFSRYGFYFREAPTISKLKPILKNWLQN